VVDNVNATTAIAVANISLVGIRFMIVLRKSVRAALRQE
jgi:hypothetical protein